MIDYRDKPKQDSAEMTKPSDQENTEAHIEETMESANSENQGKEKTILDKNKTTAQVDIPVIVAIGRSQISLQELLDLHQGQILELDRSPGSTVDILVNGQLRARGELLDVEGQLGVRVLELHLPEKKGT